MCVLPDFMIKEWAENGGIEPFDPAMVNPASIDLCWSGRYRLPGRDGWGVECETTHDLIILPGHFVLLDTREYVRVPSHLCAMLLLKSSIGQQGLKHHHAGWFDPGFLGTATLEITNRAPWRVTIHRHQPLVQLVLMEMKASPEHDYLERGRYVGQLGPTPARQKRESAH